MTDLPKLNTPARALALLLALSLAAMLVISLTERFKHPQIPVHVQPAPQAPAGMGGDAIGALMQEVAKNPQNVDALVHLVEALMTAQNWEAAETFAQRASTLDVNNPQPLYLLGVIKHNQGKHKEAAELLEKVVALHDNASVRYSLGVLYIHSSTTRRAAWNISARACMTPRPVRISRRASARSWKKPRYPMPAARKTTRRISRSGRTRWIKRQKKPMGRTRDPEPPPVNAAVARPAS